MTTVHGRSDEDVANVANPKVRMSAFDLTDDETARLVAGGWRFDGSYWRDSGMGASWTPDQALREQARRDARDVASLRARIADIEASRPTVVHRSDMSLSERAACAVESIVFDICRRRGLRQAWEGIDDDIREEIVAGWTGIVHSTIAAMREACAQVATRYGVTRQGADGFAPSKIAGAIRAHGDP